MITRACTRRSHFPPPSLPWLLVPFVVLAGCDLLAPGTRSALVLDSEASYHIEGAMGSLARIECGVALLASAEGSEGDGLVLGHAVAEYLQAGEPAGSDTIPWDRMFDRAEIRNGSSRQGHVWFTAPLPFDVALAMHYTTTGGSDDKTARTTVHCGPDVPESAPPPVIEVASLAPTGAVEVGDSIELVIEARGDAGLWQTVVEREGGWEGRRVFAEDGETAVTHVLPIPVAPSMYDTTELRIRIQVQDVLSQSVTAGPLVVGPVIDTTPPVLMHDGWPWDDPFLEPRDLTRQWAAGDTADLPVVARDNNEIEQLGYELAGSWTVRDSVDPTTPWWGEASRTFRVPVDSSWRGALALTVHARDVAGYEVDVSAMPDSVRVFPVVDRVVDSTLIEDYVADVAYDARRGRFYYTVRDGTRVMALDEQTFETSFLFEVGDTTGPLELTPGGDSLVVLLRGPKQLAVLPLTGSPVARVDLDRVGTDIEPADMVALGDGRIFVTAYLHEVATTGLVEVTTNRSVQIRDGVLHLEDRLYRSGDGSVAVVVDVTSCAAVYRVATDAFDPCQRVWGVRVEPDLDGDRFASLPGFEGGPVPYDVDLQVVARYRPRPENLGWALGPGGRRAYIRTEGGLERFDLDTGLVVDRSPMPGRWGPMVVAPDESWLARFQYGTPTRLYIIRF